MSRVLTHMQRAVALASLVAAAGVATLYIRTDAQVLTPRPEDLRYETVLNEPIAAPNRRGVVAGTSALLIRDRATGQCFLAVTLGDALGLSPTACQP